ncbi:hypothetical protein ACFL1I_03545 [Candidatus Omnitrophota bacterium]
MKKIYIIAISLLLTLVVIPAWAQNVTLSTYYPAPYGAYNQLSTRTLGVGDNNGDNLIDAADAPVGTVDSMYVAGRVGIGTMAPGFNLHVDGSGSDTEINIASGADADLAALRFQGAGTRWRIVKDTGGSPPLLFENSSGSVVLSTLQNGRVGINTLVPDTQLHVIGQAMIGDQRAPSGTLHAHSGATGSASLVVSKQGGAGTEPIVIFYRDLTPVPDEVMRVQRNGCLAIGTSNPNPAALLEVNGPIFQRGFVHAPDYVFEPDYQLETIEEHAAYMWKEKHLKGVPKAKTDENGQQMLEIGAHRMGMLEELEKAHIYIDQLNQKLKLLEEKIAALR